ncbi:sialate O-acetylesterase [Asticcacaulis sp. AND118]|uniref:sialate O-acetylesterase n=1 Tax=Asticcacaulis sp. AND118 TaxID=2840468 RepID=UPI001CFFA706|nr:sialate O-acetylesterase [Asticcacaulis sp. AND118]UDF05122.1 sialate O-acetylesterase [Asticcacaulis sp. AND118]
MRRRLFVTTLLGLSAAVAGLGWNAAMAGVRLPNILSDHMVLQAGQPVAIWGHADAGEKVTVKIAGQTQRATAGADGRWKVTLKPLKRSAAPMQMTVAGKDKTLTVSDILIGEVWLASGQSNMEKPFRNQPGQKDVFGAEEQLAAADTPQIRLFKIKKARSNTPAADVEGQWIVTTPQSLETSRFSAAAYVFGKRLHTTLNTPVGLIDSTWGGTRIEPWTAPEGMAAVPSLKRYAGVKPGEKVDGSDVSGIYNAMILPIVPYGLKGVIWYQGESNLISGGEFPGAADDYADKMEALIGGWRGVFGQDLAFYYAQLAPHLYHVVRPHQVVSPEGLPLIWEAQTEALRIRNTGMIVTTDLVDDLTDIHPRDKVTVGQRLANLALSKTYGQSDLVLNGPKFRALSVENGQAIVSFGDTGSGLVAKDAKPLTWFQIAGADGVWRPATATIAGHTVIVSSPVVPQPVAVRFAWDEAARPNLMNAEGLPALPFRTK